MCARRTATEAMAVDDALEAASLGRADDLDAVARLELLDGQTLADLVHAGIGHLELLEELRRVIQVGLGGMAAFRLGRILFLLRAEAQLHRRVTVVVRVLHLHDRTRTGLHHRDRHGSTVITEDLGHAQLLTDQPGHTANPP